EGRDKVDGKGFCGVRAGAQARVTLDEVPVAYRFETTNQSTTTALAAGWIELSRCFEFGHSVLVRTDPEREVVLFVRLCRVEVDPRRYFLDGLSTLSGACMQWRDVNELGGSLSD